MTPIVNTVHFHQLHIVKTGRVALFLAAGFVKEPLSAHIGNKASNKRMQVLD